MIPPPEQYADNGYKDEENDDRGGCRVGHNYLDGADVVILWGFQQESFYFKLIGTSWQIAVGGCTVFACILPFFVISFHFVLIVNTVLELIVEGCKAEGDGTVCLWNDDALAFGYIIVEG
jgi:hypothetical protein